MKDGNTTLSPTAQAATERFRTLRTITQKTGIVTRDEQIKILLALSNEDVLAVIDVLGLKGGPGGTK
jgi:hypothetical protein